MRCVLPDRRCLLCLVACLALCCALTIDAQILRGEWVDRSQQQIEEHRKTELIVVVLNEADRPIQAARVHIEQVRHDFVLGVAIDSASPPLGEPAELPVWRMMNAVALDRLTRWRRDPAPDAEAIDAAAENWNNWLNPIEVGFGPVLSADPARNPDRLVAAAESGPLRDATRQRVDQAMRIHHAVDRFDLYADTLGHNLLEDRLGPGILNTLFDTADARRPDADICLHTRDGLDPNRSRDLRQYIRAMRVRQVRIDGLTIEQAFPATVSAPNLERTLTDRIATLGVPVTLTHLETGGSSDVAAAINIETVLRLLFATPNVRGVYFAGLAADELIDPTGALLRDDGEPAACGQVVEGLFRGLWWSDLTLTTDDLGNARARVFTGWYRITATLPDGRVLTTEAYLPNADEPRYVVLQAGPAE